nr:60s ribosomal protein l6 [Hymenolepis microstoma]
MVLEVVGSERKATKYIDNRHRPRSGKDILEHKASQKTLTKEQKLKIKKRALKNAKRSTKQPRFPRMYDIQNAKKKLQLRKKQCYKDHRRSIRKSITPGTILILLAGRHRGKRVVFLKALESGLLLVTGPFKYNGVPLRRVNQRYVIATKTSLKMKNVKIPANVNDEFFRRQDLKSKKTDDKIFAEDEKKYTVTDIRKQVQKEVDKAVIGAIKLTKDPSMMASYLKSMFSLSKKDYPHKMVF